MQTRIVLLTMTSVELANLEGPIEEAFAHGEFQARRTSE